MSRKFILGSLILPLLGLLPSAVQAQTFPEFFNVNFLADPSDPTTINAAPNGVGPAFLEVINSDSAQFTTNFTMTNDLSYEGGGFISLAGIEAGGFTLTSNTQPGAFVNGGNIIFNNSANLTFNSTFEFAAGINLLSAGSDGYQNGTKDPILSTFNGNDAGTITATHSGSITATGGSLLSSGISAQAIGGDGAQIKAHDTPQSGPGGGGGDVSVTTESNSLINISGGGPDSAGIYARSQGGLPGATSGPDGFAGDSKPGGSVTVSHGGSITNSNADGYGIYADSIGGAGGTVSFTDGPTNTYYGESAQGGTVLVELASGSISLPNGGIGVLAASAGGATVNSEFNNYSISGETATINIDAKSSITTGSQNDGTYAIGALAISSGTSTTLNPFNPQNVNFSGTGVAGDATVNNAGTITTSGELAIGVAALGIGGAGIVATAEPGSLSYLGNSGFVFSSTGSVVTVSNTGSITTLGGTAHAIVALSSGGGGLLNNAATPVFAMGDGKVEWIEGAIIGSNSSQTSESQGNGFNADAVNVNSSGSITTGDGKGGGIAAIGIIANSIGGGGGTAGGSVPSLFVGDAGGAGGDGGKVTVNLSGKNRILTQDKGSPGVLAGSIGGGGGNGANSAGIFVAVGGQGGGGGDGGEVEFNLAAGSVVTTANYSHGIIAHSIGGGGGNGGYADSAGLFIDVSIGGGAGNGGDGGAVYAGNQGGKITTAGNRSHALMAQSIGGGGGTGGAANAYSAGAVFSASVSLGGTGGSGGQGGEVQGVNAKTIQTGVVFKPVTGTQNGPSNDGADSHGLFLQSIGGGGGDGGSATAKSLAVPAADIPIAASVAIAVGGSGSVGGDGGAISGINSAVEAGDTATIATYGDGSHGILAHSVGGGGGNGGDSTATTAVLATDSIAPEVNVAVGGSGSGGGDGGTVIITNGAATVQGPKGPVSFAGIGQITTAGQSAAGILAQSIGGGGGNGAMGNASDGTIDGASIGDDDDDDDKDEDAEKMAAKRRDPLIAKNDAEDDGGDDDNDSGFTLDASISLGGKGGVAGNGGGVTVSNSFASSISTTGSGSDGILAQSIGGGGGTGSGGSSGGSGSTVNINVAVGGSGGAGGIGQTVNITNSGSISTTGGDAVGILAQSIGGGGGKGGSADAAASLNAFSEAQDLLEPPDTSFNASVSVGGSGGASGDGGQITIMNSGTINTTGIRSYGILAHSIAGGGGVGGAASSSSNSAVGSEAGNVYTGSVDVGGNGGTGGDGQTVNITNSGILGTQGYGAAGILAQSIGGAGGVGAEGTVDNNSTLGLGANVQGGSGTNGNGGTLNITNSGMLTTTGHDAPGLILQSIGGGGGLATSGDPRFNASVNTPKVEPGVNMTLGFNAGPVANAFGGSVNMTQSGAISTLGDWSHGIVAQSVGGGGGKASSVFSTAATPSVNFLVGANGGGGNGGSVTVTLSTGSTISTGSASADSGYGAIGILAQSIGGGGGLATDSSSNTTNGTGSTDANPFGGVQVGYKGSGIGGQVELTGQGTVSTFGELAHAVVLQSIGGSGGFAGQGATSGATNSSPIRLSVGGVSQGSGANGGTVTVNKAALNLYTTGDSAIALIAQSVGGGGGIGSIQNADASNTFLGGESTGANDGGNVMVTLTGHLTTQGNAAHGIVAQSIGGGGGIANFSPGLPSFNTSPARLSNISAGNGGNVTVDFEGDLTVTGDGSIGILAQSVGGGGGILSLGEEIFLGSTTAQASTGSGGDVSVSVEGVVIAPGKNSVGIFAQSVDTNAGGSIQVQVTGGVVGGSGDGVAIWVSNGSDGQNNVTIQEKAFVIGNSGSAILYTGASSLDVSNAGDISGSLSLNGGNVTNTGSISGASQIDGNVLNRGLITVGDAESLEGNGPQPARALISKAAPKFDRMIITGDFRQSNSGAILVDADFVSGRGDFLRIRGDAVLGGEVRTQASQVLPLVQIPVLQIDGTITRDISGRIQGADSAIFRYGLERRDDTFFLSATSANFAPAGSSLNRSERIMADHLGAIWKAGGNAKFGELFGVLNNAAEPDPDLYASYLAQLSPGATFGIAARRAADMESFGATILAAGKLEETSGSWATTRGQTASQDTNDATDFRINSSVTQVGGQAEIADNFFVGGALAYAYQWISSDNGFSNANGQNALGAITAKYQTGPWLFSAAVYGGLGFYETERTVNIPGFNGTAEAAPNIQSIGFLAKAAWTYETERFYIRPSVTLNTVYVHASSFNETGLDTLGLSVQSADQTTFIATPAMEFGGTFQLTSDYTIRPYATAGVSFLTNDDWSQNARLSGAPANAAGFTSVTPIDDIVARVTVGAELLSAGPWVFSVQYEGEFSENLIGNGGSLSVGLKF